MQRSHVHEYLLQRPITDTHALATRVSVRAVVSEGWSGIMLKSLGFMIAGQKSRKKRKELVAVYCTAWDCGQGMYMSKMACIQRTATVSSPRT